MLKLASRRRSHVRLCRTLQRDVGVIPTFLLQHPRWASPAFRRCRPPSTPTQSTAPVPPPLTGGKGLEAFGLEIPADHLDVDTLDARGSRRRGRRRRVPTTRRLLPGHLKMAVLPRGVRMRSQPMIRLSLPVESAGGVGGWGAVRRASGLLVRGGRRGSRGGAGCRTGPILRPAALRCCSGRRCRPDTSSCCRWARAGRSVTRRIDA